MLGYVMEQLNDIVLDTFFTPIFMKKNRPAYKLSVICDKEYEKEIEKIIFRNTTTIGVRKYEVQRDILSRRAEKVYYEDMELYLKIVNFEDEEYIYPEYESAKKLAKNKNIPIKSAFEIIKDIYRNIDLLSK
ncbi:nickel insertion protein [Peptoanaerobacter stomatis]|nr:nickel insertion protein [Peptoanaerobacter stomatis]